MNAREVYLLDGEPITWRTLIRRAQEEGYQEEGGIYTTSRAAEVLRQKGHSVQEAGRGDVGLGFGI